MQGRALHRCGTNTRRASGTNARRISNALENQKLVFRIGGVQILKVFASVNISIEKYDFGPIFGWLRGPLGPENQPTDAWKAKCGRMKTRTHSKWFKNRWKWVDPASSRPPLGHPSAIPWPNLVAPTWRQSREHPLPAPEPSSRPSREAFNPKGFGKIHGLE